MAPFQIALALARLLVPVEVDVVDLAVALQADFLDPEAAAEVRRGGEEEVLGGHPADPDAVGRDDQPHVAGRLRPRLALTGAGGLGSVHLAFLSVEGMPRPRAA